MTAYYNEIDPLAAAWLEELIKAGHIAPGDVDTRSIEDVRPDDLVGYTQCHFFAGIGGWSLALRLAGAPDDYPVWTGSCPCQPFSTAGAGGGFDDPRHLWPAFAWLIAQSRPAVVLGEQVASAATDLWFDLVQADLESLEYAFGCVPFPAAGIGAPHIRERAYWVALADSAGQRAGGRPGEHRAGKAGPLSAHLDAAGGLANSSSKGLSQRVSQRGVQRQAVGASEGQAADRGGDPIGLADPERDEQRPGRGADSEARSRDESRIEPGGCGEVGRVAHPTTRGRREQRGALEPGHIRHTDRGIETSCDPGPTNGHWGTSDWLYCRDGKWRPVEPGTFPLVDGLPRGVVPSGDISFPTAEARVMRLKGYGNAIFPQQAAEFISAALGAQ